MIAGSKDRTMISYKCEDAKIDSRVNYPTFTRMVPKFSKVISSVMALLAQYNWYKFSIIHQQDQKYEGIANHLKDQAKAHQSTETPYSVNHIIRYVNKKQ